MRYTFFLYSDESGHADASPAEIEQSLKVYGEYINALKQAGVFVDTDWLRPSTTATTISKVGGTTVQDGPFADTKEQLGGFFVIDVPDLDAALAWAEKCPAVHHGSVEIRASGMPAGGNPYG